MRHPVYLKRCKRKTLNQLSMLNEEQIRQAAGIKWPKPTEVAGATIYRDMIQRISPEKKLPEPLGAVVIPPRATGNDDQSASRRKAKQKRRKGHGW